LDQDNDELLKKAYHDTQVRNFKRTIILTVVITLLLASYLTYRTGSWKKIPFIPYDMNEQDNIQNLSKHYGKIEIKIVEGNSMLPTFFNGQTVFEASDYYKNHTPQRNDIAEIKIDPERPYIKRIAAIPGDTFTLRGTRLYLDNSSANLVIDLKSSSRSYHQIVGNSNIIPPWAVFVIGDNLNSWDSRDYGLVEVSQLLGKIVK
jgi:signal peptidase I